MLEPGKIEIFFEYVNMRAILTEVLTEAILTEVRLYLHEDKNSG